MENFMSISSLDEAIRSLEKIRDMILEQGIHSTMDDACLQQICSQINELYGNLLEAVQQERQ